MDPSVFVIALTLSFPLFFFWRWIFRKRASKLNRRIATWLLTLTTAPILYAIVILIWIAIIEYYPNRDFDKKMWQTNKDERYEYTHDLINSKILLGKTESQVLKLLGNDADTSQTSELQYNIGFRPELLGIDPSYLIIDFKNGKVNAVIEHDR